MHSKALVSTGRPGFRAFRTCRKSTNQRLELVQLAVEEVPCARQHVQARLCGAAPPPRPAPPRAAPRRRHRPAPASSRSPDAPRCRARSAPPAAPRPRVWPARGRRRRAMRRRRRTRTRLTTMPRAGNRRRPSATTAARSSVSPRPLSNLPALAPTPRKLKRNAGAPHSVIARASDVGDLVVHGAAEQRMRMAGHAEDARLGLAVGKLEPRFERAGRPCDA